MPRNLGVRKRWSSPSWGGSLSRALMPLCSGGGGLMLCSMKAGDKEAQEVSEGVTSLYTDVLSCWRLKRKSMSVGGLNLSLKPVKNHRCRCCHPCRRAHTACAMLARHVLMRCPTSVVPFQPSCVNLKDLWLRSCKSASMLTTTPGLGNRIWTLRHGVAAVVVVVVPVVVEVIVVVDSSSNRWQWQWQQEQ